jgi:hypothetical protein
MVSSSVSTTYEVRVQVKVGEVGYIIFFIDAMFHDGARRQPDEIASISSERGDRKVLLFAVIIICPSLPVGTVYCYLT